MTNENYNKATKLHEQIKNCNKLLQLFDLDKKPHRISTQYVSIIEDNRSLYLQLSEKIQEYKQQLEEQFKYL